MYILFMFVVVVISGVAVFNVVFEVIIFLDFNSDVNIDAAPIFPDCPNNFCDPEEPLLSLMTPMTLLTKNC